MRVLRSSALKITSPYFVGDDGETPEDCTSTPTATVAHEDGTSLASLSPAAAPGDGLYTGTLTTTHTANLGRLTVTWTGTVDSLAQVYPQQFEVVGAHYASLPEIRDERDLDNTTKYPLARIRRVRDSLADRIEEWCGVAFVPRYDRDFISGDGTSRLKLSHPLPRTLLSVTVDGVSRTLSEFTLGDEGTIEWENSVFPRARTPHNVVIAYEHGYDGPPSDVRDEYLVALRTLILKSRTDLPSDAISTTFDGGTTIRHSTPDAERGRPTGIVNLDAVLQRYQYRPPAVG